MTLLATSAATELSSNTSSSATFASHTSEAEGRESSRATGWGLAGLRAAARDCAHARTRGQDALRPHRELPGSLFVPTKSRVEEARASRRSLFEIRDVSIAVFTHCSPEYGPYDRGMTKAPLTRLKYFSPVAIVIIVLTFPGSGGAQPSSRPHPRIWLDAVTIQGIRSQASATGGPVARGAARCRAARETPDPIRERRLAGLRVRDDAVRMSSVVASDAEPR